MRYTQKNAQIVVQDVGGFCMPIGKSLDGPGIGFSLVAPDANGYGGRNEDRRITELGYSADKMGREGFSTIGSREYLMGYAKHRQDILFS